MLSGERDDVLGVGAAPAWTGIASGGPSGVVRGSLIRDTLVSSPGFRPQANAPLRPPGRMNTCPPARRTPRPTPSGAHAFRCRGARTARSPPGRAARRPAARRAACRAMPGMSRRFWLLVAVLLALNYIAVALFAPGRPETVRIPYSPTFLEQVEAGNVERDLLARRDHRRATSRTRSSTRPATRTRASPKASTPRSRRSPTPTSSTSCSQDNGVVDRRRARRGGPLVPREPAARLRPDDPADRALRVVLPARGAAGAAAGRARQLRPLAREADRALPADA